MKNIEPTRTATTTVSRIEFATAAGEMSDTREIAQAHWTRVLLPNVTL
jgi:hypothetical protein